MALSLTVYAARRSLLIAAAIQPDSLDIVLTRLLVSDKDVSSVRILDQVLLQSARFLTFDRRITECWSQLGAAVRTAQALGLHRDGATMVRRLRFLCAGPHEYPSGSGSEPS
jgi:Flp pilus assembly protein CpaB